MVDIFLEYGYYIVGIGTAMFASVVSYFSVKKYIKEAREENQRLIDDKITAGVEKVIEHIDSSDKNTQERFRTTDTLISQSKGDIEDIKEDVKILEKDFKSLCQTIGKHEYIVDKVFPEYVELRDSLHKFKSKVNENILTNNREVSRNTDHDEGQDGMK